MFWLIYYLLTLFVVIFLVFLGKIAKGMLKLKVIGQFMYAFMIGLLIGVLGFWVQIMVQVAIIKRS